MAERYGKPPTRPMGDGARGPEPRIAARRARREGEDAAARRHSRGGIPREGEGAPASSRLRSGCAPGGAAADVLRESDVAAEGIFEKKMAGRPVSAFPKKPTRKSRVTAPGSCGTTCATQSAARCFPKCSKSRRDVTPLGAVVRKEDSRESHLTSRDRLDPRDGIERAAPRGTEPVRRVDADVDFIFA